MNRKLFTIIQVVVTLFVVSSVVASASPAIGTPGKLTAPVPASGQQSSGKVTRNSPDTAPEGYSFTYQGRLKNASGPITGTHTLNFTLYDALSGGSQVGSLINMSVTMDSAGLFTVNLNFGQVELGNQLYLQITVDGTPLSPRQTITPAPYAASLSPGADIIGSNSSDPTLKVVNNGGGDGLYGEISGGSNKPGLDKRNSPHAFGFFDAGVHGSSDNALFPGVWGQDVALDPDGTGVVGESNNGTGVAGFTKSDSFPGVEGNVDPMTQGGTGVKGVADTGIFASGVFGESANGRGVVGESTNGYGVFGGSANFTGIFGTSTASTGVEGMSTNSTGVEGISTGGPARPQRPQNPNVARPNTGVFGSSLPANGTGVMGEANTGAGATGVWGESTSGEGVHGKATAANAIGVHGESTGGNGIGVQGEANGLLAKGVLGRTDQGYGVRGESTGAAGVGSLGVSAANGTGVIGNSGVGAGLNVGPLGVGVVGNGAAAGAGVIGTSGVAPVVNAGVGVQGQANGLLGKAVLGLTDQGWGTRGESTGATGVGALGVSAANGTGVIGNSGVGAGLNSGPAGVGVVGNSAAAGTGMVGTSGVAPVGRAGTGVVGQAAGANAAIMGVNGVGPGVPILPAGGVGVAGNDSAANSWGVGGSGDTGVVGNSNILGAGRSGVGVVGNGTTSGVIGALGINPNALVLGAGTGVIGASTDPLGAGVLGSGFTGVVGNSNIIAPGVAGAGVVGNGAVGGGTGVVGASGVVPGNVLGAGVVGAGSAFGVWASGTGTGVVGTGGFGSGVIGTSGGLNGVGVFGTANFGIAAAGVRGTSAIGLGVVGQGLNALSGSGVYGETFGVTKAGVFGNGLGVQSPGVAGVSISGAGVYGQNTNVCGTCVAGLFKGNVSILGALTATGPKNFKIDDPLDPANKYLYHAAVESPEMTNLYNGNVTLDANGEATVQMPGYFEALNRDFRYQLTAIGAPGPNLYVAEEITNNHFKVAGGKPGSKVSWQVTGVRHDVYAQAHPSPVEQDKSADERGKYLEPDLFGQPSSKGIFSPQLGDAPQLQPVDVPQEVKDAPAKLTVPAHYKTQPTTSSSDSTKPAAASTSTPLTHGK